MFQFWLVLKPKHILFRPKQHFWARAPGFTLSLDFFQWTMGSYLSCHFYFYSTFMYFINKIITIWNDRNVRFRFCRGPKLKLRIMGKIRDNARREKICGEKCNQGVRGEKKAFGENIRRVIRVRVSPLD